MPRDESRVASNLEKFPPPTAIAFNNDDNASATVELGETMLSTSLCERWSSAPEASDRLPTASVEDRSHDAIHTSNNRAKHKKDMIYTLMHVTQSLSDRFHFFVGTRGEAFPSSRQTHRLACSNSKTLVYRLRRKTIEYIEIFRVLTLLSTENT